MRAVFVALAAFACQMASAEGVSVLGVSVGEKPAALLKRCSSKAVSADLCWLEKPRESKTEGVVFGRVELPNKDRLPEWAAVGATASVEVTKDGRVSLLSVSSKGDFSTVKHSIASRFGEPDSLNHFPGTGSAAEWVTGPLAVRLLCGRLVCNVHFYSSDAYKEHLRKRDAAMNAGAQRSISP